MQEKTPLQEEISYRQNEDIQDDPSGSNIFEIDTGKGGIQDLIEEEMSEPELMFFCKDDPEATALLKKCSKWANDENWTTMKNYLIVVLAGVHKLHIATQYRSPSNP